MMMKMKINCFCGMVGRRKTFSLISSRDHCQRSSPPRISNTPRAGVMMPNGCQMMPWWEMMPHDAKWSAIVVKNTFDIRWDDFKAELFFYLVLNPCRVLIVFLRKNKVNLKQQFSDTDRRPIILEVEIDGESFVLINFYNTNTEPEYFKILVGYKIAKYRRTFSNCLCLRFQFLL